MNALASKIASIILVFLPACNNSLASLPCYLEMNTFLTGNKDAHSSDALFPAISLSNINTIFSNLEIHSNSLLMYFFADAVPEGIETRIFIRIN